MPYQRRRGEVIMVIIKTEKQKEIVVLGILATVLPFIMTFILDGTEIEK